MNWLNWLFRKEKDLIEGDWYWVRSSSGVWFPAIRDEKAAGGWSNHDTWEDFDSEIIQWIRIKQPTGFKS